eukprot:3645724-Rhodomonas_salina.1
MHARKWRQGRGSRGEAEVETRVGWGSGGRVEGQSRIEGLASEGRWVQGSKRGSGGRVEGQRRQREGR